MNPFVFQVLVILVTGAILVFGSWGSKQMKVEFDPMNLTPKDSYMRMFKGRIVFIRNIVGGICILKFLSKTAKSCHDNQGNEVFLINDTDPGEERGAVALVRRLGCVHMVRGVAVRHRRL